MKKTWRHAQQRQDVGPRNVSPRLLLLKKELSLFLDIALDGCCQDEEIGDFVCFSSYYILVFTKL